MTCPFWLPSWPFCLNSSLFCIYFTPFLIFFPLSSFFFPLSSLSPFLLSSFSPLSYFFSYSDIGWYFPRGGGGGIFQYIDPCSCTYSRHRIPLPVPCYTYSRTPDTPTCAQLHTRQNKKLPLSIFCCTNNRTLSTHSISCYTSSRTIATPPYSLLNLW